MADVTMPFELRHDLNPHIASFYVCILYVRMYDKNLTVFLACSKEHSQDASQSIHWLGIRPNVCWWRMFCMKLTDFFVVAWKYKIELAIEIESGSNNHQWIAIYRNLQTLSLNEMKTKWLVRQANVQLLLLLRPMCHVFSCHLYHAWFACHWPIYQFYVCFLFDFVVVCSIAEVFAKIYLAIA